MRHQDKAAIGGPVRAVTWPARPFHGDPHERVVSSVVDGRETLPPVSIRAYAAGATAPRSSGAPGAPVGPDQGIQGAGGVATDSANSGGPVVGLTRPSFRWVQVTMAPAVTMEGHART
jgi:hypothetical protein